MGLVRLAYLAGPLAVRDLVAGSAGVVVSAMAFIVGCAFVNAGNLLWFAFLGTHGVVSLTTGVPAFLTARRLVRDTAVPDADREPLRVAA